MQGCRLRLAQEAEEKDGPTGIYKSCTMAAKTALLLSTSLIGAATGCDVGTLTAQIASMEATCCQGESCNDGLPDVCDEACAPVFTGFWDDCGAYLAYVPGTDSFSTFYQQCESATPEQPGDAATSCDTGALLTVIFFQCSSIDQNNPNQFCNTDCSRGVQGYISRCSAEMTDATAGVFTQAQGWVAACATDGGTAACHASTCR